jgi:uncharacterized protein DUF3551
MRIAKLRGFKMRASFFGSLLLLTGLLPLLAAQAAPYDPYPWCAAYGGSWSGVSNCGFRTWQQCMATVSGMGGFCEPNQFYNPGRSGKRANTRPPTYYGYGSGYGAYSIPSYNFHD